MKNILSIFLVSVGLLFGIVVIPTFVKAAWPQNTKESQINAMWAGNILVWQDNRLGNWDIFCQDSTQTVKPLIALSGDQLLISATDTEIYFFDHSSSKNYSFNLKSQTIKDYSGTPPSPKIYLQFGELYKIVTVTNEDVIIQTLPAPSISVPSLISLKNISSFSGMANGASVSIKAVGSTSTFLCTTKVIDGNWNITNLIPQSAPDGIYQIYGYATLFKEINSAELLLGEIIIDHSPPAIVGSMEITPSYEGAKIHWHTNEKSIAKIEIASDMDEVSESYDKFTLSHTLTVKGLTPNKSYNMQITVIDNYGNLVTFNYHFQTHNLINVNVANIEDIKPNQDAIWEGIILAEPSIINDNKILIDIGHPIILEWSTGSPPNNLKRGSTLRFIAHPNHDKGALLIHGYKSIVIVDKAIINFNFEQLGKSPILGRWYSIEGKIAHKTKYYWVILTTIGEIKVNWAEAPLGAWESGQIVRVCAIYYKDKEGKLKIAGSNSELLANKIVTAKGNNKSVIVNAPENQVVTNVETPKSLKYFVTTTDKVNLLWYSSVLIGTAFATFIIFFIRHN